ncbi:MAG: ribosomal-processing cysteine protease Prp [Ruminococcus sp.]|nr:ribosomal-processing cysteine protease Prp [Ruminococcus sp.]
MTAVCFITSEELIIGFELKGHSDYAEEGSDIVCAAVSSAAYMTANTITDILCLEAEATADDGYMMMRLSSQDALKAQDILRGFELHMKELSQQYQNNIKVVFRRCKDNA